MAGPIGCTKDFAPNRHARSSARKTAAALSGSPYSGTKAIPLAYSQDQLINRRALTNCCWQERWCRDNGLGLLVPIVGTGRFADIPTCRFSEALGSGLRSWASPPLESCGTRTVG